MSPAADTGIPEDTLPRVRHSLKALLLGVLLWLVVRPILRRVTDLAGWRRRMARFDRRPPFGADAPSRVGGIPVEVAMHPNAHRVLLYLHGGGFFMHPARMHVTFLEQLCRDTAAIGVLPAYRLAPEHPYPHGIDDCARVYEALLARGVPADAIVLAGESAGGTLVLSLLMRLRDAALPLPACAVLISAGTDLAGVGVHASYRENGTRDALVPPETLPRIVEAYAGGRDPADAGLSPLRGSFVGLPPLHFVASRDEVQRDDSVLAADKALGAGVVAEIRLWRGLMHAFPLFLRLPEAQPAAADIARFVCTYTIARNLPRVASLTDEVSP